MKWLGFEDTDANEKALMSAVMYLLGVDKQDMVNRHRQWHAPDLTAVGWWLDSVKRATESAALAAAKARATAATTVPQLTVQPATDKTLV